MKERTRHGALLTVALIVLPLAACSKKDEVAQQGIPAGYGNDAPGMPAQGAMAPADLEAWEKRDLGVKPQDRLHDGAAHGPTPTEIPGGKLITTQQLLALQQTGQKLVLLEVLGAPQTLPNAFRATPAAAPGDFKDQTQQQFTQVLQQLTQGDMSTPIVTYCANPECWMSYNAALRAIHAGYRNVSWYRGGLEAWQRAGQPLSGGQPMQGGGGPMPPQGMPPQGMPPQGDMQPPAYPQQGGQIGGGQDGGGYPQPPPQGYPQQQPAYPQQQYPQPPPAYPQQQGGYPQQQGGYQQPQQPGYPQQQYPQQQYPQQQYPQQQGYPQQD